MTSVGIWWQEHSGKSTVARARWQDSIGMSAVELLQSNTADDTVGNLFFYRLIVTALSLSGIDPVSGEGLTVHHSAGFITAVDISPRSMVDDCWLSPGLFDLQVNGYAGVDLNDGALTEESFRTLAATLASLGVTRFLPTLITAGDERLLDALATIATACDNDPLLAAAVPGIHVEGPFISPDDGPRGAHPLEHVRVPSLSEVDRWQRSSGNRVSLLTLSPHWPGSAVFIRSVTHKGIQVALGHTAASHAEIIDAVDAGARLSTHLGNGAAATLPRHPNVIWSQLAENRLMASFIADSHHLPRETLVAMIRAKGVQRCILVSDTAALGGMPAGHYSAVIGGEVELSPDGRLSIAGTPYLAGAARPLPDGIAHCASLDGISLADALSMATHNPGSLLGIARSLSVGEPADMIQYQWQPGDPTLTMLEIVRNGRWVSPSTSTSTATPVPATDQHDAGR